MTSSVSEEGARPLVGIALKICSVVVFVAMMTCIKAAGSLPPGQVVFFRSFFAMIPIMIFLGFRGELGAGFATSHLVSHVVRGLVGVSAMAFGFFGLMQLPLPEAITINYAQPLFVIILSALFMGETVRIFRWSAVFAGLIGVVIISWPKLTLLSADADIGHGEALGVLAVLASASLAAVAMILVRRLVRTERTPAIVLWFSLTATAVSLFTIPFGWQALDWRQVGLLSAAGACGGCAQLMMTQAYRYADMSTIAPFEYTSMLLGIGAGYVFFSDVPTVETIIGGSIVVMAGLFIIWREQRLGLERKAARRASSQQG